MIQPDHAKKSYMVLGFIVAYHKATEIDQLKKSSKKKVESCNIRFSLQMAACEHIWLKHPLSFCLEQGFLGSRGGWRGVDRCSRGAPQKERSAESSSANGNN